MKKPIDKLKIMVYNKITIKKGVHDKNGVHR